MIIVTLPSEEPEDVAAKTFATFAEVIHSRVPFGHGIDLHKRDDPAFVRGICGDHGRVQPTKQGFCPVCAGYLHDGENVAAMRRLAKRLDP